MQYGKFRIEFKKIKDKYECIVVGAGPAGLTAAIYLARYNVDVTIISKSIGGKMILAPLIDDYPGLPEIPGTKLAEVFVNHIKKYGVPMIIGKTVVNVKKEDDLWCVELDSGERLCSYAVILAVGAERRKLGVPGEEEFIGKGVSYCATCDGPFFKDRIVAVVGGGNAALSSALYLSTIAKKVYLIHRRETFRAIPHYIEEVKKNPKIEVITNTVITGIIGDKKLTGVKVKNVTTNEEKILNVDGIFIEIGSEPPKEFLKSIGLELDEQGYIAVNPDMSTNLPGIFACGEVTGGRYKHRFEQIITAAAEGAIAAKSAYEYIIKVKKTL